MKDSFEFSPETIIVELAERLGKQKDDLARIRDAREKRPFQTSLIRAKARVENNIKALESQIRKFSVEAGVRNAKEEKIQRSQQSIADKISKIAKNPLTWVVAGLLIS